MDKYNIVFIKTENGEKEMLGRRAEDYVLREFADFSAKKCRIAKTEAYKEENALLDGCVNVVLTLDMPLVKKKDIEMLVRQMKQKNISLIRLGAKDSLAKICIGKGVDDGVFCKQDAFLKIGDAKSYNIVYNLLKDEILDGLLHRGVQIIDKATTFVDDTVNVESGVIIKPFCTIEGGKYDIERKHRFCIVYPRQRDRRRRRKLFARHMLARAHARECRTVCKASACRCGRRLPSGRFRRGQGFEASRRRQVRAFELRRRCRRGRAHERRLRNGILQLRRASKAQNHRWRGVLFGCEHQSCRSASCG